MSQNPKSNIAANLRSESSATRWLRRLITIPVYIAASVLIFSLSPIIVCFTGLFDLVLRNRFAMSRAVLFIVILLVGEMYGLLAAFLLWLRFVLTPQTRESYVHNNYRLQWAWAQFLVGSASKLYALDWEIENAPTQKDGPFVFLMRHCSLGDTLLPITLLSVTQGFALRYVLKRELLWQPSLDIVGQRLPNFFVDRSSANRTRLLSSIEILASDLGNDDVLFIFPEGTRFTEEKRAKLIAKLESNGSVEKLDYAKKLRHLLPPRPGGALTMLKHAHNADVLFCAHTGFEGSSHFGDFWKGRLIGQRIRIKFWRIPSTDIPREKHKLGPWLNQHWVQMDQWIDSVQGT